MKKENATKDKVLFFLLGALVAIVAYLVGDIDTLTAEEKTGATLDFLKVKDLLVEGGIVIGNQNKEDQGFIVIAIGDTGAEMGIYSGGEKPSLVFSALKDRSIISTFSASKKEDSIGRIELGTLKINGKWVSMMDLQDSRGENAVATTGVIKK